MKLIMGTGIAIGLTIGLLLGAVAGAGLMRYAFGLHEKVMYGARDGTPVLGFRDAVYEHAATDADDTDTESED